MVLKSEGTCLSSVRKLRIFQIIKKSNALHSILEHLEIAFLYVRIEFLASRSFRKWMANFFTQRRKLEQTIPGQKTQIALWRTQDASLEFLKMVFLHVLIDF